MTHLIKQVKWTVMSLVLAGSINSVSAFSMLGPFADWQVERIGYSPTIDAALGGPMNLGEEYRWNIPYLTYGFDESFVNYFGLRGVQEVEKAIAILNGLRAVSKYSADLREFSTDTRRRNQRAEALGLLDVKSVALGALLEQVGLASPELYTWTLRNRVVIGTVAFYTVVMRNFDPVTWAPSAYVNDVLYTYSIFEFTNPDWADAVEIPVDPAANSFTAVASVVGGRWGGLPRRGEFVTGLTRDDVGGLRYIYRKQNLNVETLLPDTEVNPGGGATWTPVDQFNTNVVDVALRPGIEKLQFRRGRYDSIFGSFILVTNRYTDTYMVNSRTVKQGTRRAAVQPDVLFAALDLGGNPGVVILSRTSADDWLNNDEINGQTVLAGPGVIAPQVAIIFNKTGPGIVNDDSFPFFMTEAGGSRSYIWGSFDGTTNAPVVYPIGTSIQDLEALVLGGGN